jgi:hypothetical protein
VPADDCWSIRVGRGFKITLNSDVMPRLRVHDIYITLRQHKGMSRSGHLTATPPAGKRASVHQNINSALAVPFFASAPPSIRGGKETFVTLVLCAR